MFTWLFAFFRKPAAAEPTTPVAAATVIDDVAEPVTENVAEPVISKAADELFNPISHMVVDTTLEVHKKSKSRQIHWMISDCTKYRNDQGTRCTFYSNLRDASVSFYVIVNDAIHRMQDEYNKHNFDNASKKADTFFTFREFEGDVTYNRFERPELDSSNIHVYHKGCAFECDGIYVYLSHLHLGENYSVELGT
jgi:hypothetical protein